MAIVQAVCDSFKLELLQGLHNFTTNTFRLALYSSAATLGATTTVYTTAGEISGTGYVAGGAVATVAATQLAAVTGGFVAIVDFTDVAWPTATFTARGALLYNSTAGNRAVAVLDFGSDKIATGTTFTVQFPAPTGTDALVRVS